MKLTEDIDEFHDGQRIEDLLGDPGDISESRLERLQRFALAYLIAPGRIAWEDWRAKFGIAVVGLFLFMALVWEKMYGQAYHNIAPRLVKPFDSQHKQFIFGIEEFSVGPWTYTGIWQYPLGTDELGRPILMRIVNAAPLMLELLIAGAIVSVGIAIFMGVVAGYKGGFVDELLMGITDVVLTIPGLPLIVLLAAIFEPSDPFLLGMLLAIDNWPGLARSLRSQVLTIRTESYVEASRSMGVATGTIVGVDIIPQLMPYVLINAAQAGRSVITEAVALYFLGFLPASQGNWGRMMDNAYQYGAISNPEIFYLILWPMLVLTLLSFGLVLLSQGLDQIFNPRLRARHMQEDEDARIDPSNN